VAIVLGIFAFVLPGVLDYGDVWDALTGLTWLELTVLIAAALVNLLTYGPSLMAALPGLRFQAALMATLASSASTYVAPGGPTVGLGISYVMLRAWGFRRRAITLALSVSLVWGQLVTLAMPPLALAMLWFSGGRDPVLERVAQIGVALFVLLFGVALAALWSERFACWAGDVAASIASRALRVIGRGPVSWSGEQFAAFRAEALQLVGRRWHWLTLGTVVGHLGVYLVLVVTLWAMGIETGEVSLVESFAAFALIRLLGSIPIGPGGFGFVEVGLTTALIGFGGDEAAVVAAVLVYRFLTVVVPLVCGGVAGLMWRRYHPGEGDIGGALP
jgi:uncharacterized membrane protein YbhN (UPF0104 family)